MMQIRARVLAAMGIFLCSLQTTAKVEDGSPGEGERRWSACQAHLLNMNDGFSTEVLAQIERLRSESPFQLGLPGEDFAVEIRSPTDLPELESHRGKIDPQSWRDLEALRENPGLLRPESDEVFYLDQLGLSKWNQEELRAWRAMGPMFHALAGRSRPQLPDLYLEARLQVPRNTALSSLSLAKRFFLYVFEETNPVPGLDEELLRDVRASLGLAKDTWARAGAGGESLRNVRLQAHWVAYSRLNATRAENGLINIPHLLLPVGEKGELTDPGAEFWLTCMVRYTLIRNLVHFSDGDSGSRPAVQPDQRVFAAAFPELTQALATLSSTGKWSELDDIFRLSPVSAGDVLPYRFTFDFAGPKNDLNDAGIRSLKFTLALSRGLTGEERPMAMNLRLEAEAESLSLNGDTAFRARERDAFAAEISSRLNRLLGSYSGLERQQIFLTQDFRPRYPLPPVHSKVAATFHRFCVNLVGPDISFPDANLLRLFFVLSQLSEN